MKKNLSILILFLALQSSSQACTNSTNTIYDTLCHKSFVIINFNFINAPGIYRDTIKNGNSTGCDSIIVMVIAGGYTSKTIYDTFCQGDSVFFNNRWRKNNGTYRDTLVNSVGCDSFLNLQLRVIGPAYYAYSTQRICQNSLPFVFGDSSYTTAGLKFYTMPVKSAAGCDSVWWFNLTVDPAKTTTVNRRFCQGGFFFFKGQNRYSTATIVDSLLTSRGCDSIVTLNLIVDSVYTTNLNIEICDNQTYLFNGVYLTTSGFYKDTLKTVNNCDSFINLILKVKRTTKFTLYQKYCSNNPIFFGGQYLSSAGTYMDTLINAEGCDSFLTLVLYKDNANFITRNDTICPYDSLYFDGQYFNKAGTYIANYKNIGGCDSVITLNLSLHIPRTVSISVATSKLLKSTSGFKYYQWYKNDNVLKNKTSDSLIVTSSGDYNVAAVDSHNCYYTSSKLAFVYNSISNSSPTDFDIYPNPATESITINSDKIKGKSSTISIYNIEGKLVKNISQTLKNQIQINITDIEKGMYFIKINTDNTSLQGKFIKE